MLLGRQSLYMTILNGVVGCHLRNSPVRTHEAQVCFTKHTAVSPVKRTPRKAEIGDPENQVTGPDLGQNLSPAVPSLAP